MAWFSLKEIQWFEVKIKWRDEVERPYLAKIKLTRTEKADLWTLEKRSDIMELKET